VEINKQTGNLDDLSLSRAGRMNQIIRLAARTGLSFPDLDWALQTVAGIAKKRSKQLVLLARLLQWKKNYGLSVDEACALLGKRLRDFGGTNGVTFFDQVYNKLRAKDQPLRPDSGLQWKAGTTVAGNQPIAHRLMAALGVTQDELMMMQEALLPIRGRGLALNAATFASLYRSSLLAKMFGLSVRELLEILELMGPRALAAVTKGLSAETADVIDRLAETRTRLRLFSLSPDKLHHILTGETNATARMGVAPDDAVKFIQQLQSLLTPAPLAQDGLPGQNGSADHHDNQKKVLEEQLGAFFKVSHLRMAQIRRWLSPQDDFLSLILRPVLNDPFALNGTANSPQQLQIFNQKLRTLELINRYVELAIILHLTHSEIEAMLDHPEIFEISQPRKLSLEIVERLSDYKQLCLDLEDRQHNLLGYFKLALGSKRKRPLPSSLASRAGKRIKLSKSPSTSGRGREQTNHGRRWQD